MSRYSITIEFDAATVEEAISLVAVGEIFELVNIDLSANCLSAETAELSRQKIKRRFAELGISDSDNLR